MTSNFKIAKSKLDKNPSATSSAKSVAFHIRQESSQESDLQNVVSNNLQNTQSYFYRQCEDIKSELFDLAINYNLLLVIIYILLPITLLCRSLQMSLTESDVEVQCEINELAETNWTFYQIRNISSAGATAKNVGCFYYNYNYSFLSTLPYSDVLEKTRAKFQKSIKLKCSKYLYKNPQPKQASIIREFDLVCRRRSFQDHTPFHYLGTTLSAFLSGIAADMYGRRPVFILSTTIIVISSCIIPLAKSLEMFVIGKTIMSMGISSAYLMLIVIFTELCHSRYRSLVTLLAFSCTHVGTMVYYAVFPHIYTWRLREAAAKIPFLIILFGIMFVPESPRWLMVNEQWKTAWKTLGEFGGVENQLVQLENGPVSRECSKQLYIFHKQYFQYRTCITTIMVGVAPIMREIVVTLKVQVISHHAIIKSQMLAVMIIVCFLTAGIVFTFTKKSICCNIFFLLTCCFIAPIIVESKTVTDVTLILAEILLTALLPVIELYILELFPTTHRATSSGFSASVTGGVALFYLYLQHTLPENTSIQIIEGFLCSLCLICTLVALISPHTYEDIPDRKDDLMSSLSIAEQVSFSL